MRTLDEPKRLPPVSPPSTLLGYGDEDGRNLALILAARSEFGDQMKDWAYRRGYRSIEPSDDLQTIEYLEDPSLRCVCVDWMFMDLTDIEYDLVAAMVGLNLMNIRMPEYEWSRTVRLVGFLPAAVEKPKFEYFDMHVCLAA